MGMTVNKLVYEEGMQTVQCVMMGKNHWESWCYYRVRYCYVPEPFYLFFFILPHV